MPDNLIKNDTNTDSDLFNCALNFDFFKKKWTLPVLIYIKENAMVGFTPILEKFSISPSILSSTLKELNTKMLISRNVSGDITPITVEYSVTEQGYELIQILSDLFLWYQKYLQLS